VYADTSVLCETVLEIVNAPLYLEQYIRFPIVQLRDRIELDHNTSELLLVSSFECINDRFHELCFTGGSKTCILRRVFFDIPSSGNGILNTVSVRKKVQWKRNRAHPHSQSTEASFEPVLFHAVSGKRRVERGIRHLLETRDGLGVLF
jgi:hypothetical protein